MEEILESLTQVNGIQGTLIVGKDGLVIAYSGDIKTDPDFLGATIADFFTTAENITDEKFAMGNLERLCIETNSSKFFLNNINSDTFLVIITEEQVNIGLIRMEMKAAAESLKEVL
jgi:uncharacterized protein